MKKIRVTWEDAITYRTGSTIPKAISIFETTGLFYDEKDGFIIVKDPLTRNVRTLKQHPDNRLPKFYCIPRMTILNIEEIPTGE